MAISIYTTILMSFERYVRIGHTCRLKDCSYMTDDNFKYYLLAIVLAPCVFYVPKFFELYAEETRVGVDIDVNCHSILHPPKVNMTAMKGWSNNSVIALSLENFNILSFFRAFWCGSWRFHAEIFRRATQSYRTTAGRSVSKGMSGGEFHRITPPGLETQRYPGTTTFFQHRGIFLHVILYLCST